MERASLTLFTLVFLAACTSDGSEFGLGESQRGPVLITTECESDRCEQCEFALRDINVTCSQCLNACARSSDSGCNDRCDRICDSARDIDCEKACSGDPVCLDYDVSFAVSGRPDESVRAACLAANGTCVAPADVAAYCAHFAVVESTHAIDAYRCYEGQACVQLDACEPKSGHDLRGWYCEALEARGGRCTGTTAITTNLASIDPWLRDDVASSVEACELERNAMQFDVCVKRWLRAVGLFASP